MKKIRVINFFITFANDITLAHAVSKHREVSFRGFCAEKELRVGLGIAT